MAANQEELLETIGNMTVLELSEFVDASPSAQAATGPALGSALDQKAAAEQKEAAETAPTAGSENG